MSLYTADGAEHIPAVAREVYDVSGAGDTVIATLGVLLGAGADLGVGRAHRQRGGRRRRRQARHRGRHARRAGVTRPTARRGRKPRPSTAAPSAAARARSGRASARTAARGTRWSRPSPRRRRRGSRRSPARRSAVRAARQRRRAEEPAVPDRARGIRPRAGRRARAGRRHPAGRRSRASASRRCCCRRWRRSAPAKKALYVTGEESVEQVALRAQRLGLINAPVSLLAEVQLEAIVATIGSEAPEVVVIDSIQTAYTEALTSAPGSVAQVRECAAQLTRLAKQRAHRRHLRRPRDQGRRDRRPARARAHRRHRALFRGRHAFELPARARDQEPLRRRQRARRVRDDRAGLARGRQSVGAVPVAARRERRRLGDRRHARGLAPAAGGDPGAGRPRAGRDAASGCPSASIRSGCRCCSRCCTGTAASRPAGYDVFVNAVGGVRINEPAADLAILLAVHSSLTGRPLPAKTLVFGEVGLAGEIRPVQRGQERIKEAAKLGFRQVLIPNSQ